MTVRRMVSFYLCPIWSHEMYMVSSCLCVMWKCSICSCVSVFFMVWKIKMRSDESSWETWGPLETPKQWWGQRGTCFVFFPHIHHIFSIIHPTTQQLSAFPSSNSLKVSDAHNSTMPRCCPLALYPPQPRAIIHNLSVELGVKEVG